MEDWEGRWDVGATGLNGAPARSHGGGAEEARWGKGASLALLENSPGVGVSRCVQEQESLRNLADNHPFICSINAR